ncbi:hypothetical protein PENFLA_c088G00721, partial [Penicillium flavigenum]
ILLTISGIGIVQSVFIASWNRRPENFGIPLDYVDILCQKAMGALLEVEKNYQGLGHAMREEFFPGKLSPEEFKMWESIDESAEAKECLAGIAICKDPS